MDRRRWFGQLIERYFGVFRKSQRTTMVALAMGLMMRGRAGLAAIARGMQDDTTVRYRIKRAWRFFSNGRVRCELASQALIQWVCRGNDAPVVLMDWTDLKDGYQMLAANVALRRRSVPIGWLVMYKGQFTPKRRSRNDAEEKLILQINEAMQGRRWILIADRGFARVDLFRKLKKWKIRYVIRVCGNPWIRTGKFSGPLDNLPRKPRRIRSYSIRYHKKEQLAVRLVVTHEEPAPECWYLVTSEGPISAVRTYRKRMWIEQTFRDAKSHLLFDKVWLWTSERMERMMLLVALVILAAILVAIAYKRRFPHKDLQFTTLRKGVTFSIFNTGIELIRLGLIPPGLLSTRLTSRSVA